MRNQIYSTLLLFITLLSSCSSDDENLVNLTDDSTNINDSALFDPTFTGTACFIQRNSELTLTSTINYEYFTNLVDTNIEWEIDSGDIEIISGENSKIVTIQLGDSFTKGVIIARGVNDIGLKCGVEVIITTIN